ncbi:MAG: LptA/OstA family protein [Litorimonas sp.]
MNIFTKAIRLSFLIGSLSLPFICFTPAYAQFSNSGVDTVIDADDSARVGDLIILTGQVDIRQGDTRLLADKVTLKTGGNPNKNSGIISATAVGNFYYITAEQEVRGDQGVFESATDIFTVTGDVILLQDDNVVTGDKLLYNVTTEKAQVQSDCKGRKCGPRRRVSILIKSNGTIQNNP